jgi:hypothetical protein
MLRGRRAYPTEGSREDEQPGDKENRRGPTEGRAQYDRGALDAEPEESGKGDRPEADDTERQSDQDPDEDRQNPTVEQDEVPRDDAVRPGPE